MPLRRWPLDLRFALLYCVLLVAANSFVVFGHIFFSRYDDPIFFFSVLASAPVFERIVRPAERRRRTAVAGGLVALDLFWLPIMSWHRMWNRDYLLQRARFEPIADAALLGVPGWRALRVVHDVPVVHARPETHPEPVVGTGGGGAGR